MLTLSHRDYRKTPAEKNTATAVLASELWYFRRTERSLADNL